MLGWGIWGLFLFFCGGRRGDIFLGCDELIQRIEVAVEMVDFSFFFFFLDISRLFGGGR